MAKKKKNDVKQNLKIQMIQMNLQNLRQKRVPKMKRQKIKPRVMLLKKMRPGVRNTQG